MRGLFQSFISVRIRKPISAWATRLSVERWWWFVLFIRRFNVLVDIEEIVKKRRQGRWRGKGDEEESDRKRDKEEGETKKRWIGREKSKMGCGVWRGWRDLPIWSSLWSFTQPALRAVSNICAFVHTCSRVGNKNVRQWIKIKLCVDKHCIDVLLYHDGCILFMFSR